MTEQDKELLKDGMTNKCYEYIKTQYPDIDKEEGVKIAKIYFQGFADGVLFILKINNESNRT